MSEKQPKTNMSQIDDAAKQARRRQNKKQRLRLTAGNTNITLRSSRLNERILRSVVRCVQEARRCLRTS